MIEPRRALFILLNPSTADATEDDPTIRRCIDYARRWGCGTLGVVNLFALRSTTPGNLYAEHDPVGPGNDEAIIEAALWAQETDGIIVAGWGLHGTHLQRDEAVLELLDGINVHALHVNEDGTPKHPLYCRADIAPQIYAGRGVAV
jgi:hypothetical protein